MPVHAGAAAYIDDDEQTFFDKYSDMIYLGAMFLGVLASGATAVLGRINGRRTASVEESVRRLVEILGLARTAGSGCGPRRAPDRGGRTPGVRLDGRIVDRRGGRASRDLRSCARPSAGCRARPARLSLEPMSPAVRELRAALTRASVLRAGLQCTTRGFSRACGSCMGVPLTGGNFPARDDTPGRMNVASFLFGMRCSLRRRANDEIPRSAPPTKRRAGLPCVRAKPDRPASARIDNARRDP